LVKKCSKCGLDKSLDSFYKGKGKDGYEAKCKSCRSSASKDYYIQNSINRKEYGKDYYSTHTNEHNKRCISWHSNNRTKSNQLNNEWEKKKRKEDKFWAAKKALRIRILQCLQGKIKSKNTLKIVGLNEWSELKTHFENQWTDGMSWENYGFGEGKWVIDHKLPLASAKTKEEVEKLNHFSNLQPMWWRENLEKSDKIL
jgi:hypothetical protein